MFNYNEHIEECGIYLENELAFIEIDDEYFSESSGNESSESSKKVEERFKKLIQAIQDFFGGLKENILKKSTEISMKYKLNQAEKDAKGSDPDLSVLDGKYDERKVQNCFSTILNNSIKTCSKLISSPTTDRCEELFLSFEDDMVKMNDEISTLVNDLKVRVVPSNVSASFQWEMSGIHDEINTVIQNINSAYCMKLSEKVDKAVDGDEISLMKWKLSYMQKIQSHIVSFGRKVSTMVSNKKFEKISKAYR